MSTKSYKPYGYTMAPFSMKEVVNMDTEKHMQRLAVRQAASLAKVRERTKGRGDND